MKSASTSLLATADAETQSALIEIFNMGDWPDPAPIFGGLPPVEPFNAQLLPESFRPMVVDTAERMQVPQDYPAAAMVVCLSGAVSRRAIIQPKVNDTGFRVTPNIWGGIVAPPGFMKTPTVQAIFKPLIKIENEWREQHKLDLAAYRAYQEENELRLQAWKEQYKAAIKNNKTLPERPQGNIEAPIQRRLVVNDATFETLHKLMAESPAGLIVLTDELSGWFVMSERQGREGERQFYLQCWSGDVSHTIERCSRPTVYVPHCCLTMFGTIQPSRLKFYLTDAEKGESQDDGMAQRFQIMVWPDAAKKWRLVDAAPDAEAEATVEAVLRSIVELPHDPPLLYRFAPDAQDLYYAWLRGLEEKIRGDELHPALTAHLSKYRSLMPSLALIFQIADDAAAGGGYAHGQVTLEQARRAAAWTVYLESHAHRIYSEAVSPRVRAARELAKRVRAGSLGKGAPGEPMTFTARDVYLKGWKGLGEQAEVYPAIELLVDADWLREQPQASSPKGGRPTVVYEINPKIFKMEGANETGE